MSLHTADAIVLRRYPYRETSVTVTCLTDRYGKLKGLIKGLRRYPNRHRTPMEPMTVNRIVFYDTAASQLHLIGQCELLRPMAGLERDLDRMTLAANCVKLADAVLPLEEPQPASYHLLRDTLERLSDGGAGWVPSLHVHFIVRLLHLAGFQPQVSRCAHCHAPAGAPASWSIRLGGLLCHRCLHEDPQAESVDGPFLDTLKALAQADHPLPVDEPLAFRLRDRLQAFLSWRLEKVLCPHTVT